MNVLGILRFLRSLLTQSTVTYPTKVGSDILNHRI